MNNLTQTFTSIPNLRDDQNFNYIEKKILSVLHEQKVSFKQTREIFDAIEARLKNKLEDELVPHTIDQGTFHLKLLKHLHMF